MLKPSQQDVPFLAALVAIALALLLNLASARSPECSPAEQAPATQNNQQEQQSFAGVAVIYWPLCVLGNAIYAHREVLNAASTLVIGAFTLALFIATYGQLKHLNREFIATHRPRLRVRLVKMDEPSPGTVIRIHYRAVNVGESDAKKIRTKATVEIANVLGDNRDKPAIWTEEFPVCEILAAGEPSEVGRETTIVCLPEWKYKTGWGLNRIRIHGTVTYEDRNGVRRNTGFYRYCSQDVNRFRLPGDQDINRDYEYED